MSDEPVEIPDSEDDDAVDPEEEERLRGKTDEPC